MVRKLVKESIDFERGLEPKEAMKIGIADQIERWWQENLPTQDKNFLLYYILRSDLDEEIRKNWAIFLLNKYGEFESEEWEEMKELEIDVISNLKNGFVKDLDDIGISKKNNKFEITFSEWGDFADFFRENNKIDSEFIVNVLNGEDTFDYFQPTSGFDYCDDIIFFLKDNYKKIPILKEIKERFIKILDYKGYLSIEDLIKKIYAYDSDTMLWSKVEKILQLKRIFQQSAITTKRIADESKAFDELKEAIIDHFELENIKWFILTQQEGGFFSGEIKPEGLKNLYNCIFSNEDQIRYFPPQYSWDGEWDPDIFNEELESQLENINESIDFERNIEPAKAMGIGIFTKRDFETIEKFIEFIYKNLTAILGVDSVPDDIINDQKYIINDKYFWKIQKYRSEYCTIKGNDITFSEFDVKYLRSLIQRKL